MNEQAERYLSTLGRSLNTIKAYRYGLSYYFDVVGERVDNDAYETFLGAIKHLSPSTKTVMKTAVMGLFDFLEIDGDTKRERLNKHYLRGGDRTEININEDAIEKLISYCEGLKGGLMELRDRAFVLTMVDSGFRIFELCSIKRGDIDWRNERVFVVGKGRKQAYVRLSKRSVASLKEYLRERQKFDGSSGKPMNTLPVFVKHVANTDGLKGMTVDGMRKAVKQRMVEAGIGKEEIRIHDLRHYFVTKIVRASNSLETARKFARHENIEITSRYAHLSENELDETYDEIFNRSSHEETD